MWKGLVLDVSLIIIVSAVNGRQWGCGNDRQTHNVIATVTRVPPGITKNR